MPPPTGKIIVALSGGVDSAVAALRLLEAGHAVEALHMTNWDDDDGYCTAAQDLRDARRVCRELGITLHEINFVREYRDQVFRHFLAEYRAGRTPNPDVPCNRFIKFGAFLQHARRLGATAIATGHYARLTHGDRPRLAQPADLDKDQTYFLHAVRRAALRQARFPLGELRKSAVRRIANDAGLPVYAKRDSTGICFIGKRPFRQFLSRYIEARPGRIETPDGWELGRHDGLMFYTLGQRQGLGIGGRAGGDGNAWYVAGKDTGRNALIVVQGREHRLLWSTGLRTHGLHWINGAPDALRRGAVFHCAVRTRYRQAPVASAVTSDIDGAVTVRFRSPQWAVTPGQYVVCYRDGECLGGGPIDTTLAGDPITACHDSEAMADSL